MNLPEDDPDLPLYISELSRDELASGADKDRLCWALFSVEEDACLVGEAWGLKILPEVIAGMSLLAFRFVKQISVIDSR